MSMDEFVETIPTGLFFIHFGWNNSALDTFKRQHPTAIIINLMNTDEFIYLRVPDFITKLYRSPETRVQAAKAYEQSIIARESARKQLAEIITLSEKQEVVLVGFYQDEKNIGDYRSVISRLINDYNAGLLHL